MHGTNKREYAVVLSGEYTGLGIAQRTGSVTVTNAYRGLSISECIESQEGDSPSLPKNLSCN